MNKKVISIFLIIVSIVMIGTGTYLMNSNKYMFETSLERVLSYINKINDGSKTLIEGLDSSSKYKITTDTTLTYSNNKIGVSGNLYANNGNRYYMDLDAKIEENSNENIGFIGLIENKKLFFKIKDLMSEIYYTDIEESIPNSEKIDEINYKEIFNLSSKDIKVLTDHLKKSIVKNISNNDLSKTKEKIILGEENTSLYKLSLKITNKMISSISKDYLKSLSSDTKAIQVLQKIDKNITKDTLESIEALITEPSSSENYLILSFYCKVFGDVTRIELSTSTSGVDEMATSNVLIAIDTFTNKNKYNTTAFTMEAMGNSIKVSKESISKDKSNINVEINTNELNMAVKGTMIRNDSTIDLTLTPTYNGQTLGKLTFKITTVNKNEEYKLEIGISIEGLSESEFSFSSINNIYLNEDIPSINIDEAKNINELSDEEKIKIQEFFQKITTTENSDDIEENKEV